MAQYFDRMNPILFLLALFVLSGCSRADTNSIETVCKAPEEHDPAIFRLHVSSNARHVAWLAKAGIKYTVTIDGVPGGAFDSIGTGESFSPDGEHFVYVGNRDQKSVVVLDDKEFPAPGPVQSAMFSPDSSQIAYVANTFRPRGGSPFTLFIEGPKGGKTLPATDTPFAFSSDGKHFAYCGGPDARHQMLVVDDVPRDILGNKVCSFGYGLADDPIRLSPDGKRIAYNAKSETGEFCVCDGIKLPTYNQVWSTGFSPDGSKFACVGLDSSKPQKLRYELSINGNVIGDCTQYGLPVFSPDSSRFAYQSFKKDRDYLSVVIVDGVAQAPHSQISAPVFSPNGKRLAYAAMDTMSKMNSYVVLDGVSQTNYASADAITFSADSSHLAYRTAIMVKDEHNAFAVHQQVIFDGKEQVSYDRVTGPAFSPDSRHLAYCAMRGIHTYLVLDNTESEPFDRWLGDGLPVFDSANHVRCLAVKDGTVVRVSRKF